jgi:hypothetical protein
MTNNVSQRRALTRQTTPTQFPTTAHLARSWQINAAAQRSLPTIILKRVSSGIGADVDMPRIFTHVK